METYTLTQQEKLENAQKAVKKVKGFYTHALVYVCVNIFIIGSCAVENINNLFQLETYMTAIFWGFGLLAHGLSVFVPNFIFGKNWEERKIKELMEKEKQKF